MAKRSKKRVRHLTLFLLKPEIQQFKNALKDFDSLTLCKLRDDSPFQGRFYYQPQQQKPPGWQALVQSGLADKLNLHSQSTAAVLFVRAAGRRFALTFGYGRNLLKPDSFERNFGLKVALNTVDPKNLKSVDARTFEDLTLVTRRQASRGSELSAFGLDVAQDVLRAVTGRPRDADFAKQVTGADALAVAVEAEFRELAGVCKRAFKAYGRDDYKKDFGFIDHLRPVADPSLKSTLEAALIDALKSGNTDRFISHHPSPSIGSALMASCIPRRTTRMLTLILTSATIWRRSTMRPHSRSRTCADIESLRASQEARMRTSNGRFTIRLCSRPKSATTCTSFRPVTGTRLRNPSRRALRTA